MTIIKIHDTEWFKEHCKVVEKTEFYDELVPQYDPWKDVIAVGWLSGDTAMRPLEGKVLEVESDIGDLLGRDMTSSRYMADGYRIPNWAIEWVKEVK